MPTAKDGKYLLTTGWPKNLTLINFWLWAFGDMSE